MKKIISYMVILICAIVCIVSCSMNKKSINSSNKINDIRNYSQENINSMLTLMPIFVDDTAIYYAEAGKTLKKKENDHSFTLDACEENELIQDIYVNNKDIYYVKQSEEQIDIIKVNENKKQKLLTIPHSTYTFGEDFVYGVQNSLYYYNSYDNVLYLIDDIGIQKCINDITSVSIDGDNIYYSNTNGSIYVCDKNLTNDREIWSIRNISKIEDEFLDAWCEMNMNEYTTISHIAINNNILLFTICANSQTKNGLLFSMRLDDGEIDFSKELAINNYQLFDNYIYLSGSHISNQKLNDGIFRYNLDDGEIMDLGIDKENIYINGFDCYFWENEYNNKGLKKLNLITHSIETID